MQLHKALAKALEAIGELQSNLVIDEVVHIQRGVCIVPTVLVENARLSALQEAVR